MQYRKKQNLQFTSTFFLHYKIKNKNESAILRELRNLLLLFFGFRIYREISDLKSNIIKAKNIRFYIWILAKRKVSDVRQQYKSSRRIKSKFYATFEFSFKYFAFS